MAQGILGNYDVVVDLKQQLRKQAGREDGSVRSTYAHNDLKGDGHVVTYNLGPDGVPIGPVTYRKLSGQYPISPELETVRDLPNPQEPVVKYVYHL